jgi:hypothetical protein
MFLPYRCVRELLDAAAAAEKTTDSDASRLIYTTRRSHDATPLCIHKSSCRPKASQHKVKLCAYDSTHCKHKWPTEHSAVYCRSGDRPEDSSFLIRRGNSVVMCLKTLHSD